MQKSAFWSLRWTEKPRSSAPAQSSSRARGWSRQRSTAPTASANPRVTGKQRRGFGECPVAEVDERVRESDDCCAGEGRNSLGAEDPRE